MDLQTLFNRLHSCDPAHALGARQTDELTVVYLIRGLECFLRLSCRF